MSSCSSVLAALASRKRAGELLRADEALERLTSFDHLASLLSTAEAPALLDGAVPERRACSHAQLHDFVERELREQLEACGVVSGDRVALLFPNGPTLACAILGVLAYCAVAPLNPANTAEEIAAELDGVRATVVLATDVARVAKATSLSASVRVVVEAKPSQDIAGLFDLLLPESAPTGGVPRLAPLRRECTAMVLHTSGTSGRRKVVPHLLEDLVAGCLMIGVRAGVARAREGRRCRTHAARAAPAVARGPDLPRWWLLCTPPPTVHPRFAPPPPPAHRHRAS